MTGGASTPRLVPWPEDARARAELLVPIVGDARVIAWTEGLHHTREFLSMRNAAVATLVEEVGVTAIAAETSFTEALAVDAYLRGEGPDEPDASVLEGAWSWGGALQLNRELVVRLRRHNESAEPDRRVRFYGLDPCGAHRGRFPHARRGIDDAVAYVVAADPEAGEAVRAGVAPLLGRFSTDGYPLLAAGERDRLSGAIADLRTWFDRESADRQGDPAFRLARHQATLAGHLDLFLRGGGRGAQTARRDAAQADSLRFVLDEHGPAGRILLFEQVDHLIDLPGTLGHHLRVMLPGQVRTIGSVWERAPDGSTDHRHNVEAMSTALATAVERLAENQRSGNYFCDLGGSASSVVSADAPDGAARFLGSFDATLYVPTLTAAR